MKHLLLRGAFLTWVTFAVWSAGPQAQAQLIVVDQLLDDTTATRVEIRSVFDPMPPTGFAPLKITATNGLEKAARWQFQFIAQTQTYPRADKSTSAFQLDVAGKSTQSAVFLAPVGTSYKYNSSGYNEGSHTLAVTLIGTGFETYNNSAYNDRVTDFPAIAISKALADNSLTKLEDALEAKKKGLRGYSGRNDKLFASRFLLEDLPQDWLGYSGFDFLLLTVDEWKQLKPGVQQGIRQWVRLGGKVHLYTASVSLPDQLRKNETGKEATSLGEITLLEWNGKELDATASVDRYWGQPLRHQEVAESFGSSTSSKPDWTLMKQLGERHFASWQVVVFLVIFGILVGPINLFVLAPSGKRHKLFYTTPLLSFGASVLMIALILIQDGLGGTGRRFLALNLEPTDATAYLIQEQVSRTGVMLGTGFELKQAAQIQPLALPRSPWVKLSADSDAQATDLTHLGAQYSGNYFQSRAEQAQQIRAAVSTRARMELKQGGAPDAPPSLVSALGFTVTELYYMDASQQCWKVASPVSTGQQVPLVRADKGEFTKWWEEACQPAGEKTRTRLVEAAKGRSGCFFARTAAAGDFVLPTSTGVRWKEDQIVVFGTVALP